MQRKLLDLIYLNEMLTEKNSYIFFDKMIHKVLRRGKKCLHPYLIESTSSRLITEVKQSWAWLVLGWVTAWEYQVL